MSKYVNILCGRCKHSISGDFYRTGTIYNFTKLGPSQLKCPACGCLNKTGRKTIKEMKILGRVWVFFIFSLSLILESTVVGFIGTYIIDFIIGWVSDISIIENKMVLTVMISVIAAAAFTLQIRTFISEIRDHGYF